MVIKAAILSKEVRIKTEITEIFLLAEVIFNNKIREYGALRV